MTTTRMFSERMSRLNWVFWLAFAVLAANVFLFYVLNCLQPLSSDDYMYCFIFGQTGRVASIGDIVDSQIYHWLHSNGRTVIHCIVQFLLMYDKAVFNIVNTVALCVLAYGCMKLLAEPGRSGRAVVVCVVLALFVLLTPGQGATLLNVAAGVNTLWAYGMLTMFLWLVCSSEQRAQLTALLLSPLMGNVHEGMSIGVLGFLLLYTALNWQKKQRLLLCAVIILFALGLAGNLFAPGTRDRMAEAGVHNAGLYDLFLGLLDTVEKLFTGGISVLRFSLPTMLLASVAPVGLVYYRSEGWNRKNVLVVCFLFAALLQACAVLSGGSALLYDRAWAGVLYFSLLSALVYFIPILQSASPCWKAGCVLGAGGLSVLLFAWAMPAARVNSSCAHDIIAQHMAGRPYAVVSRPSGFVPIVFWHDCGIVANCTYYTNRFAARYHGVNDICSISSRWGQVIESISPDALAKAQKGGVQMLENGILFFMVDRDVISLQGEYSTKQTNSVYVTLGPWTIPVIPMGDKYGVFVEVDATISACRFRGTLPEQKSLYIEISEELMDTLRSDGELGGEQVQRQVQ